LAVLDPAEIRGGEFQSDRACSMVNPAAPRNRRSSAANRRPRTTGLTRSTMTHASLTRPPRTRAADAKDDPLGMLHPGTP
jgi:hypothetical protein